MADSGRQAPAGDSIQPALLELFATVDAVFTEPDALHPQNRQVSLGRIYRTWKTTRAELQAAATVYGTGNQPTNNTGPPA